MKEYPKVERLNSKTSSELQGDEEYCILEKIDGNNFRWGVTKESEVLFGSRTTVFTDNKTPLQPDKVSGYLTEAAKCVKRAVENAEQDVIRDIRERYIFFGEATGHNRVEYVWGSDIPHEGDDHPSFLGFDVWDCEQREWLPIESAWELFEELGLETVPVVDTLTGRDIQMTIHENGISHLIPTSSYREPSPDSMEEFNQKGMAEGVIIKRSDSATRWKVHHKYMKEVNRWGTPRDGETIQELKHRKKNAKDFVDRFVTPARVEKVAHKLVTSNEYQYDSIEMGMMRHIPKLLIKDVMQEEGANILYNEFGIELTEESKSEIREELSDECSNHLKKICFRRS